MRPAAATEPVLDVAAVPYLRDDGRASYTQFLMANLPRAAAISSNGWYGWFGGTGTLAEAEAKALKSCTDKGGLDCSIYVRDLDVVGNGRAAPAAPAVPLIADDLHAIIPDQRYIWHGPAAARGIYVWGHGTTDLWTDARGKQPQGHVRAFNNAGFDVVRFDRAPGSDDEHTAQYWLRRDVAELRRQGWRKVIVGGQSRGAWTALQMLDTPGLVDGVVAIAPASMVRTRGKDQYTEFPSIVRKAKAPEARVVVAQFADDWWEGDEDERRALLTTEMAPHVAGVLLIDRPAGFTGHYGGDKSAFALQFGRCIEAFIVNGTLGGNCATAAGASHQAAR